MPGQKREIVVVFFLSIITLGIYWLAWYYMVNSEMRRHSPQIDVAPGLAVICLFIPIVNLVSLYNSADRVLRLQRECDDPGRISPLVALLASIFIPLGIYTYLVQSALNRHWELHERRPAAAQPAQVQSVS
jgi:hypothetical protein